ncbi:trehalose and maltose hydrolase (phosphorylase) [Levilactobacillus senmaizukei DSM 21775 = NBRC 103853]|uniref:Trehalose and maltose hydrolase (Phosphorylase) n=1 Tax=Levilactobacillus senmaizukei DSM 21775 = NBRC 103853 TaxID=1423803 RepID=A0A0R2DN37_9LACO|nr:glycosyl hydrolase family 65 protein [Levilactobacillus senmaizukei]KRN02135.1 trehalose and maltose hydrolase (phosphorylase) [Levilactobacillus senmaizukei DSM 21775 = NBRC 103853]
MKLITLHVLDDSLEVNYQPTDSPTQRQFIITYNPEQTIGENLENLRTKLAGLDVDGGIVDNALSYPFSDTVVGINHQRIDIGLAIANMLNIPVVSRQSIGKAGIKAALNTKRDYLTWHLDYYGQYTGKRNYGQEAMLTVGNGFFGLRGAYTEAHADADNYPGMYTAGLYDQLTTNLNGRNVKNEDLVNLPNAQSLSFGVDHQPPFQIKAADIQDIYRSLDLHTGVLTTTMLVQLSTGHSLQIETKKLADFKHWHRLGIQYRLTPLNFSGTVQIYSAIDGSVINDNVERYRAFDQHHVKVTGTSQNADAIFLEGQTRSSKVDLVLGSRLTGAGQALTLPDAQFPHADQQARQMRTIDVQANQTYTFEKIVVLFTSRETHGDLLEHAAKESQLASFEDTLRSSTKYWQSRWADMDIQIEQDMTSQKLMRVNLYHLFSAVQAISSGKIDASINARGLDGEAYRGHVFWDEMFDLPVFTLHDPELTRQLLLYRYRRLPAAKQNAADAGYDGAMYPWQSGTTGDEQSQTVHLNPLTNTWDPDYSSLQRHVSLAIAYNVIMYCRISGDEDFMQKYGLEMLQEITKFWISKAKYDGKTKRYTIDEVMGPDEFHENYPNASSTGLANNAYTNLMVTWLFNQLTAIRDQQPTAALKAIDTKTTFTSADIKQVHDISHHLKLDLNDDAIIGQFEGYFKLPTLDFQKYRQKYGDISRMDRILKAEGKSPDAYQVAKQADALMAFYSLDATEVESLMTQLGYSLPKGALLKNLQFYLDRTTHGSTLSRVVYAALTAMAGNMDQSWQFFSQALLSDYYDIQGGTTAEGIHLGVMGAVTFLATRYYAGIDSLASKLTITPHLPHGWNQIAFKQLIRGIRYTFEITHHQITVTADQATTLKVMTKSVDLKPNEPVTITY